MTPRERLLDPVMLARLATLELRVRAVMEGLLSGLHRSPHHGQSVEFAEHEEYAPGDDVRRIDWKAYGRLDRYYVKRFEHETNLRAWLVVDASASMGWKSAPERLTKLEYASALAASLAHLLVRQGDAAGLLAVNERVVRTVQPRAAAAQMGQLVAALGGLEPSGTTRLGSAVDHLLEHAPRRGLVVVLSDLLDREEGVLRFLTRLRRRRHDVVLLQVLDPAELDFPYDEPTLFLSVEDDRQVEAHGRDVRKGYLEALASWLAELRRAAAEAGVEHVLCRTDRPLDEVLVPFLARRERRAG